MNVLDRFFDQSPTERAAHYRQLADDMRPRAEKAVTKETRVGYLNMAVRWLDMTDRLDAEYGKLSATVAAPRWLLYEASIVLTIFLSFHIL